MEDRSFFKKITTALPGDLAGLLLGRYVTEVKTWTQIHAYIGMFLEHHHPQ
jgi:hypothetical protein